MCVTQTVIFPTSTFQNIWPRIPKVVVLKQCLGLNLTMFQALSLNTIILQRSGDLLKGKTLIVAFGRAESAQIGLGGQNATSNGDLGGPNDAVYLGLWRGCI